MILLFASIPPSSTGTSVILTPIKAGTITLSASTPGCGPSFNKVISISPPRPIATTISPYQAFPCSNFLEAYCARVPNATSYIWNLDFGAEIVEENQGYFSTTHISTYTNVSYHYLTVTAKNSCGQSFPSQQVKITKGACTICTTCCKVCGPQKYIVLPNPTSGAASVKVNDSHPTVTIKEIQVFDKMSTLISTQQYSSVRLAPINTSNLHNGVYYLHIYDGSTWEVEKLIVQ